VGAKMTGWSIVGGYKKDRPCLLQDQKHYQRTKHNQKYPQKKFRLILGGHPEENRDCIQLSL